MGRVVASVVLPSPEVLVVVVVVVVVREANVVATKQMLLKYGNIE